MSTGLIFRQLLDPESSTYTYLLGDAADGDAILIDPVREQVARDRGLLVELGLKLKYVLETHVHADHVTGAALLREATGALAVVGNGSEVQCADILIGDGGELSFGAHTVSAIHTPGHTPASYSFRVGEMVFTGDSLLIRGSGRSDFQGGSAEALYDSITGRLFALPDQTWVYPGHDYKGLSVSTIGEEKQFNPRVGGNKTKAEFVAIMAALHLPPPKKIKEFVPANQRCGEL